MHVFLTGLAVVASSAIWTVSANALPIDFELYTDLRLSHASGEPGWFQDWFGKTRYGGDRDGNSQTTLRLSEVSLIAKADISWDLQAFAHIKYDPEQNKPVDIIEAYFTYAPAPKSEFSYALKAGMFFPHISRENTSIAWTSPYTITPSAANSWVGEEIRALGLEAKVTYKKDLHRLDVTAAAFGFNDAAGTLLAFRGWVLGGTKVGAFSRLPLPPLPQIGPNGNFLAQPHWVHPIREIDGRPGYYTALDYTYNKKIKIGAFYYDNRGDPEQITALQYGWDTRFWNLYGEVEIGGGVKLISQYMTGRTLMGFVSPTEGRRHVDVDFDASFILATKTFGRYRMTARYDWFGTDDNSFRVIDNNDENGSAFTLAFTAKLAKTSTLMFEYLRVDSDRPARSYLGFADSQSNDVVQLSFRQRF